MRSHRLRWPRGTALPHWMFGESAGIQISGDSGSGKSNALEIITERLFANRDAGLLFVDPHGVSARKLHHIALAAGSSVARRVVYLQPSEVVDGGKIFSINPLDVPGQPGTLRWDARLTVVVEVVAKILLAAWGETDFDSKPILFKNVTRILTTLAYTGLSLADAKLFLDVQSPLYAPLVRACPDLIARHEMAELPELRAPERQAQLESAKNRFLGLLSNPLFEAIVGRSRGALNFQQLYDDHAIVIINLELGGVLRTMDQEILANLFLTQAIFTVLNAPAHTRYPYYLIVDELPVFRSSFELLLWISGQVRKFLARLVVCHQGVNLFPDRGEDRLLQAITGQCRTHLLFRHGLPSDVEFFGRLLALPTYDPLKIKHEQRVPMQFQVGHRIAELYDESAGTNSSTGSSATNGSTQTVGESSSQSFSSSDGRTLVEAVERARSEVEGRSAGSSTSSNSGTQQSTTQNASTGTTRSRTKKQQLVPVIETRSVVTSVQFFTREEQEAEAARDLTKLATGQALLYVSGTPATPVQFPLSVDPYAKTPQFGRKKVATHRATQERQPAFATLAEMRSERDRMLRSLVTQLHALIEEADHRPASPLLALQSATQPDPREVVDAPAIDVDDDGRATAF